MKYSIESWCTLTLHFQEVGRPDARHVGALKYKLQVPNANKGSDLEVEDQG